MKRLAILLLVVSCEGAISDPPHHPRRMTAKDACLRETEWRDGLTVQCGKILMDTSKTE